ncbi:YeeE/YedE family protein [Shewanella violacea]|uniref:Uncharacterized protein n=1 Tax=Shewanella violacea (strain JCM 10179 / CIP 106290 / LMG 19151 / DSS12) TaxID=637905 RepID=D4ZG35_SHEVD|nr:YeeE/YedE family protein [Shewanella violacea]BAJ00634.1 conserved hypothetical protein [Shewanella violacea DSS12]
MDTSLVAALLGGMLIGLSAIALMIFNGRIAGISGILSRALFRTDAESGSGKAAAWQWYFLFGIIFSGVIYAQFSISMGAPQFEFNQVSTPLLCFAGLLVGLGNQLGSGCTSGHGICGIGRFSLRSIIATCVFMLTGVISAVLLH